MIEYTIKKSDVETDEPVIVKKGHEYEFKLSQVREHMDKLVKARKEMESQIDLEKAKMHNVAENHAIITTLTPEQLVGASIYADAEKLMKLCEERLALIDKAEKEYKEDLEEIEKQTGLTL